MKATTPQPVPGMHRGTRIGRQVFLGAAAALGAALLIALVGALALARVGDAKDDVILVDAERRYEAANLVRLVAAKSTAYQSYLLQRDQSQLTTREDALRAIDTSLGKLDRLARTTEGRQLLVEVRTALREQDRAQDDVLAGARNQPLPVEQVGNALAAEVDRRKKVFQGTDALVEQQAARIQEQIDSSNRTARNSALLLGGIAVVGIAGAVTSSVAVGRRLNARLDPLARSLDAAAAELVAGTSQQVAASGETQTATQETLATLEELVQTAQDNANRARQVADQAQESADTAVRGRDALGQAAEGMAQVREQVEVIARQIVGLADQARAISSITVLVDELSEQTHLLALNASIEAARAGEHGRGFAVVAAEVRDLAERAKKAIAQISERVEEIQSGANTAVLGTEEGTRRTRHGVISVEEATGVITQLSATIAETAIAAEQIAASSGQQAAATSQIGLAMRNIEDAAAQTLAASRQAEETGRHLSAVAGEVRAVMGTA